MNPDVIVVGAGPSGCAAAYDLAMKRYSVLLLDKRSFPSVKPCAGGLTVKTIRALRYSIQPVVRSVCQQMAVGYRTDNPSILKSDAPVVFMTERSEFDSYCFHQTMRAGAEFHAVKRILAVAITGRGVELETDAGTFRSQYLVGADGANSTIRKLCAPFSSFRTGFAIEAKVPVASTRHHEMTFDFGVVRSGYGWVFPKDDHLNVGLYTCDCTVRLKAEKLSEYVNQKIGDGHLSDIAAFRIGLGGWGYRPRVDRVLLVGDAAGLADPLLGEGIHNAVKSGQAVAWSIISALSGRGSAAAAYDEALRPIRSDIRIADRLARIFYRFPVWGHTLLAVPFLGRRLMRGSAMGLTMREIGFRFFRL